MREPSEENSSSSICMATPNVKAAFPILTNIFYPLYFFSTPFNIPKQVLLVFFLQQNNGFIKGAQNFIIGAAKKSTYDLENFGYAMEEIILFATDLGCATCWIGGTFKRSNFAIHLSPAENETVPAISPIGYPSKSFHKIDKITKWVARSRKRHLWESIFFEGNYNNPLTQEKAGDYYLPLEMVRIAPSASNRQPWRIIKEVNNHNYHFYINQKTGRYKIFRSWPDFPRIDIGIAICHFNLTLIEYDMKGEWQFSKPDFTLPSQVKYIISWISK